MSREIELGFVYKDGKFKPLDYIQEHEIKNNFKEGDVVAFKCSVSQSRSIQASTSFQTHP